MLTDQSGNHKLLDDDRTHSRLKLANLANNKVLNMTKLRQLLNFIQQLNVVHVSHCHVYPVLKICSEDWGQPSESVLSAAADEEVRFKKRCHLSIVQSRANRK